MSRILTGVHMSRRTILPIAGTARAIRTSAGIGQRELARRLGYASPGGIVQMESPERFPGLDTLTRVAEACGFTLEIVLRKKST